MLVRQSDLKQWQSCPLKVRYDKVDGLRRLQSGSLTFGSIIHHCTQVMEETGDLEAAILLFKELWLDPSKLGAEYPIDYYVKGTSWVKYMEEGQRILRDWFAIFSWDTDLVLAREYTFTVPIGDGHHLTGTIDKLKVVYRADLDRWVLLISDYKTSRKTPTYGYLDEDLQFTAYCYATTQDEFWEHLPGGRGLLLRDQYRDFPRYGQWVQLSASKTMDAGIREQRHFNRLVMAVNAYAQSLALRIFVPNLSGESCRYCEFRQQCGLPELIEEDAW